MPHELIGQESFGLLLFAPPFYNKRVPRTRERNAFGPLMQKLFLRIIGIVLAPCLITDPTLAVALSQQQSIVGRSIRGSSSATIPFTEQALAEAALSTIRARWSIPRVFLIRTVLLMAGFSLGIPLDSSNPGPKDILEKETFEQFLADPQNSIHLANELNEDKTDFLTQWLSTQARLGTLSLDISDYGAALAWLIQRFPLRKTDADPAGEKQYRIILNLIRRAHIVSMLPAPVTLEEKVSILRSLSVLDQSKGSYSDKINSAARTLISLVGQRSAGEIAGVLEQIPKDEAFSAERLEIIGDVGIMGASAVTEADRQGWYHRGRSFARHYIVSASEVERSRLENFASGLKSSLRALPQNLQLPLTSPAAVPKDLNRILGAA